MTDAALSVTQDRVEQFTKTYLETSGCSVAVSGDELVVTVPDPAPTELLDPGTTTLVCASDPERLGDEVALHPESETFQNLLREAADRVPVGRIEQMTEDAEVRLPEWLVESEVSVAKTRFVPYYDRTAVVGLFRIGIETVSEYQTTLLRGAAVDATSTRPLPGLTDRLLARSTPDSVPVEATAPTLGESSVREALTALSDLVVEQTRPTITEIRDGATRAAGAELDEYRQLQDQRIDELEAEISAASDEIETLNTTVDETESQAERVEMLQERKQLKRKRGELQSEVAERREARSVGFPEKRREVGDRHSLEVVVEPLTVTEYQYEQGELEVTIVDSTSRTSVRVGYGNGIGVTESVACERCGSTLSADNPLRLDGETICCTACQR